MAWRDANALTESRQLCLHRWRNAHEDDVEVRLHHNVRDSEPGAVIELLDRAEQIKSGFCKREAELPGSIEADGRSAKRNQPVAKEVCEGIEPQRPRFLLQIAVTRVEHQRAIVARGKVHEGHQRILLARCVIEKRADRQEAIARAQERAREIGAKVQRLRRLVERERVREKAGGTISFIDADRILVLRAPQWLDERFQPFVRRL